MSSGSRDERRWELMRFGILGTGVVGKTLAAHLTGLGHDVMVGTRAPEETLSRTEPDQYGNPPFSEWQQEHPEVKLGIFGEAAAYGEMVVNATAGAISLETLDMAGEETLNTMNAYLMVDPAQLAEADHTVFVCGDDAEAKAKVTDLLGSFGWTDIIDLGDITTARGTEMLLPIWLRLFGALQKPVFNFKIVR